MARLLSFIMATLLLLSVLLIALPVAALPAALPVPALPVGVRSAAASPVPSPPTINQRDINPDALAALEKAIKEAQDLLDALQDAKDETETLFTPATLAAVAGLSAA